MKFNVQKICLQVNDRGKRRLKHGSLDVIYKKIDKVIGKRQIKRIWSDYRKVGFVNVNLKRQNCGRKSLLTPELEEVYEYIEQQSRELEVHYPLREVQRYLEVEAGLKLSIETIRRHQNIMKKAREEKDSVVSGYSASIDF